MKMPQARILLAAGALSLAFIGGVALAPALVSGAAAQITGGQPANVEILALRGPGGGDLFQAAADYIGITTAELRTEMGTDKSMADVAIAHGKTRDGLVAALTAAATDKIEALVDQKGFPAHFGPGVRMAIKVDALQAAADYLGTNAGDLRTQLQAGKTLAEIADATSGKSRDGLIDAIVQTETEQIDQAVANGRITADQATQFKANLEDRVTTFVDATHPMFGGRGPGFGPGAGWGPRGPGR